MNATSLDPLDSPTPIERIARPFQIFARFKASGAIVLFLASLTAIVWANSPFAGGYMALLRTPISFGFGQWGLEKPLILWVNDALMGVFFFVVGLEIKREVLAGELATPRKAMLPIAGAIGGMIVPALFFLAFNWKGAGANGWGIPMATDIAFALGVLSLAGSRVPLGLKIFLTALAIVDDLGAIIVIAVFYTEELSLISLGIGGLLVGISVVFNLLGVRNAIVYFCIGALVWLAFLKSGVHATLASVCMAMTIPARTRIEGQLFMDRMTGLLDRLRNTGVPHHKRLLSTEQQNIALHMEHSVDQVTAPLQQIEHALIPLVTFFVMPVFGLANAGVTVSSGFWQALADPVCLGVMAGLFFGKQIGILSFSWLAVRLGLAVLPAGLTWRQIHAVAVLGGIGFTMSIFIGGLAFTDPESQNVAKVGILAASAVASFVGLYLLWSATRQSPSAVEVKP